MLFSNTLSCFLVALVALSFHSGHLVQAGSYSLQTPTSATRWAAGQQGLVSIVSTDKAKSAAPTNDRLLTVTLRQYKNIFQPGELVATIRDHIQLLVPFNSTFTQVALDIADFVVPTTVPAGSDYFVRVYRDDGLFDRETADSPRFEILAASAPGPTSTVSGTATATLTATTTTAATTVLTTTSTTPTPTTPAAQTCNDIKEQCAAQGRAFVEATATTACSCGATLALPTLIGNSSPGSIKANVKSTFQNTGGPTAAFAFMLLVVMTLF